MNRVLLHVVLLLSLALSACDDTDIGMATRAGLEAVKAVTLDDADVMRLARQTAQQADRQHVVAPSGDPYARRLQRLLADHSPALADRDYNFKVYHSPQINAFAMADGSIRIYSGLMDFLNDDELLFVIGHEVGHVVKDHIKEKIRLAYAGSALRKAIASQENEAGAIARSALGALAENLANAQFSQHEEREADDFGLEFLRSRKRDPLAAVSALHKLATLGGDHGFLSSHPAPKARAKRLQQQLAGLEQQKHSQ